MVDQEENDGEVTVHMITENDEPDDMEDKYYMAYFLFYALGVLTLVPANFFTTATDYWMYKFRDPNQETFSTENRTKLQADFASDYSIVANVSNLGFLILTVVLIRKISITKRIIGSLSGAVVMFAWTIIFVEINTDTWQTTFFVVTLIMGFLLTGFCSVFMVTLFELVAKFPPDYLVAILSGQSICGILAALVQIFSLSIGASSKTNGLVYFMIGMFFVFLTLVSFLLVYMKSMFFFKNLNKIVATERPKITKEMFLSVLNKIKFYMISMIIVLGCSIMIHPGVTSLVISVDKGNGNKWNDVFFVPVATFLFYHLFDYVGREAAGKLGKPTNGLLIFIISVCRIALVPMLMLCNAQPRSHLPVVFNEDYAYIIFIIVFAITNGYLVNLCVLQVPLIITSDDEKKLALILILVFMVVSLGACSFLSAAMVKAL